MSHMLRMVIGCVLPLLLIFLLPLLGIDEGLTLFVAIVLMFACHLLMMGGGHGAHHGGSSKGESHHAHS